MGIIDLSYGQVYKAGDSDFEVRMVLNTDEFIFNDLNRQNNFTYNTQVEFQTATFRLTERNIQYRWSVNGVVIHNYSGTGAQDDVFRDLNGLKDGDRIKIEQIGSLGNINDIEFDFNSIMADLNINYPNVCPPDPFVVSSVLGANSEISLSGTGINFNWYHGSTSNPTF